MARWPLRELLLSYSRRARAARRETRRHHELIWAVRSTAFQVQPLPDDDTPEAGP